MRRLLLTLTLSLLAPFVAALAADPLVGAEKLAGYNGDWVARTRLIEQLAAKPEAIAKKGPADRGRDYNHSTYCDLVINGLVGLRPRGDDVVDANPLVPADTWDWFCLDRVAYHGRTLTILWDKTGRRYGKGAGLRVLADGREIARSEALQKLNGKLP